MSKLSPELINQVTWMIPNALVLIGARSGDEWNAMTASWITQVSMEPVSIAVSIDKKALTHRLVGESGAFSVNLWSPDDTRVFVKFSKPATKDGMRLNDRPFREGATGVPVFEASVAWIEAAVVDSVDVGTHTLFIGEVVAAGRDARHQGRAASMSDTRMKYGGVRRGGH
ncbi:high molecular weight rubredoxin [bacterium BMS3Abin02]|nr:high molecular weight rubredoxin [bacterium BMS3Abin02]GBE21441.1 high molecular weight rubredoxin [bacterium BMS3Bbin01]HDH26659.1 flavin reductase [Actinomycetota bacterium]